MAKINEFFNNYIFSVESANKVVEFINLNVSLEKIHIIKLIKKRLNKFEIIDYYQLYLNYIILYFYRKIKHD